METIGRYQVIRALGHGAMGRVVLAHDPSLDRSVALKVLHEDAGDEDARARLRDEARTLAALSHPGIVMIFEIGEHDGQEFIAMEYLAGRSLRELLQLTDSRPARVNLVAICAKVAVAVGAAHSAGILHRDIKPENVVVTDGGDVKVVDFGISRRLNVPEPPRRDRALAVPIDERVEQLVDAFTATLQVTTTGRDTILSAGTQTVFGTPGYMAPEVLTGGQSSAASDVYGLGVMLYECLAGRRPYDGPSLIEVMARVIDASEPPPRLDDELADLVERMLSRDPAMRPTIDEVVRALAPVMPASHGRRSAAVVVVAVVAAVAALGAIGVWRLTRGGASTAAVADKAVQPMSIAVEPISIKIASYGSHAPTASAIADVIGILVGEINGNEVVGPVELFAELQIAVPKGQSQSPCCPPKRCTRPSASSVCGTSCAVRSRSGRTACTRAWRS